MKESVISGVRGKEMSLDINATLSGVSEPLHGVVGTPDSQLPLWPLWAKAIELRVSSLSPDLVAEVALQV